jgi:feruloyl esterase
VFKNPAWNYKSLNFDADMAATDAIEAGIVNATTPDLRPFAKEGGKLIHYHGWADPQIPTGSSVDFHAHATKNLGGRAADTYRLFMVPGMAHCGGGTGTSTFDMLTALESWVEKGAAPASIPASRVVNGALDRTRALCVYPQRAAYKGTGDVNDAANFVCK